MNLSKLNCLLLAFLLSLENVHNFSYRAEEDSVDNDGTCICGLNTELLDRLEKIITLGTTATCSSKPNLEDNSDKNDSKSDPPTTSSPSESSSKKEENNDNKDEHNDKKNDPNKQESSFFGNFTFTRPNFPNNFGMPSIFPRPTTEQHPYNPSSSIQPQLGGSQEKPSSADKTNDGDEKKPSGGSSSVEIDLIAKLTAEIHRLESIINRPQSSSETSSGSENYPSQASVITSSNNEVNNKRPENGGFLGGVEVQISSVTNTNDNQEPGREHVKPGDVAAVIESTVPNVVSNIFSNIHNLTVDAQKNPQEKPNDNSPAMLTSINGQSINVQGGTSDEITAQGEKLFMAWIEQQLETLHLTASMAVYIRRSAINLFRRIVKQYVDRMQKVGGSIELNVQRATQLALNNTQNLIAFLLKHYLYYAGGLMRIIGEQVSRTGKRLDSTGETISHLPINPFDIISKVMDSLPNPSDYAKYFHNIGKQLVGDLSWLSNKQNQSDPSSSQTDYEENYEENQHQEHEQNSSTTKPNNPSGGLFKKTMSSLSKTLSSWIG